MRTDRTRRSYLASGGTVLLATLAGCSLPEVLSDEPHRCAGHTWDVHLSNEYDEARTVDVTIRDGDGATLFSDTFELAPVTDRDGSGTELDVEVEFGRRYTFEVAVEGREPVTKTTDLNCGDVYIDVTESDDLLIRDQTVDHYPNPDE